MSIEPVTGDPFARVLLAERLRDLSDRLADLLERFPAAGERSVASAVTFLRDAATRHPEPTMPAPAGPGLERDEAPLERLVRLVPMTGPDLDLLVLAGMPEDHEGYASVFRTLHPRGEPRATTGLALMLLAADDVGRLRIRERIERGPATRAGVLAVDGDAPFPERNLVVAEGLWPVLNGIDLWPADLAPASEAIASFGVDDAPRGPDAEAARRALRDGAPCTVLLIGSTEEAAVAAALGLVESAGRRAATFPGVSTLAASRLRTLQAHALARDLTPILGVRPAEGGPPGPSLDLSVMQMAIVVAGRDGFQGGRSDRPSITVIAEPLSAAARADRWRRALPELTNASGDLAGRYRLAPGEILAVAGEARALARWMRRDVETEDVARCVRFRSNLTLPASAQLVRPAADWDTLVLPPGPLGLLRDIELRVRLRERVFDEWRFLAGRAGRIGVRALFSGAPGTGKTLSAEVLAHALGLDLLVVDLGRVVSKWLGETERNLSAILEDAERRQAVLLFDEADALFGRRTEIGDAHDRWANLETSHLLSKIERFEGLVVLSTNLRQNIDPAFMRRMEFVVEFPEPSAAERESLWRKHLSPQAPLDEQVDLRDIAARYPVVGGWIRSASVSAAFLAAAGEGTITQQHLVSATRREYEKSGRAYPGDPPGRGRAERGSHAQRTG